MQAFTQKTLALAVLAGALLAAGIAGAVVMQAQLKQAQADAQQMTQAESDFARLQTDLARWQKALSTARSDVALRQEPLDLSVALPPEQLNSLIPILSKVFDPEGYFSLKQFKFEWKTAKEGGAVAAATAAVGQALPGLSQAGSGLRLPVQPTLAHVNLQGDRTLILKTEKGTP
jgi:hypothetical protein